METQLIIPVPVAPERLLAGGLEEIVLGGKTVRFKVPPGVTYGQILRLKSLGYLLGDAHTASDLHLLLNTGTELLKPSRDVVIPIRMNQRLLVDGGKHRFVIRSTKLDIDIPRNTDAAQFIRIRNKAHLIDPRYGEGDILLEPQIERRRICNYFGLFDSIGTPSGRRISIKFIVPGFEFTDEFVFTERPGEMNLSTAGDS